MPTNPTSKNAEHYICNNCNFVCCKLSNWNKHILTRKHYCLQNPTSKNADIIYKCTCGKIYKHSSSLYAHRKKCVNVYNIESLTNNNNMPSTSDNQILSTAIMELIKQNNDLRNIILDQNKHTTDSMCDISKHITSEIITAIQLGNNVNYNTLSNSNNNNNNNINTNNTFNLHVFLNETCKNAMNLSDFVNSLNVTIADLEETGRIGFSDGITKIIVKGLKELNVSERPIHCTDVKRETIYVKEENVWQKDENHEKLTKAIKQVSQKNTKNIMEWQKLNPEYSDSNSKQSSRFNKLLLNVMSGGTIEEQQGNFTKVVKNISREVILNKNAIISI